MRNRQLGATGPVVSELGLGCMGMSDLYGTADEAESVATIHAALDEGITLLDTGDFYGMGHNELLIREAVGSRADVTISVKFGALRDPDGGWWGTDGRPESVQNFLAYTLRRLGTDHVDIYRPARLDPEVPIEDTVGALAELVKLGHVRHIGLSEVDAETIRRAHAVHPIADVQVEYSLLSRGVEDEILPTCRALGIGITAYGVLSPRFQGDNLRLVEALREIADDKDVTVAQLAIAWVAQRGDDVVPLVGARRRERLAEALVAVELELTDNELAMIEAAGERYAPAQMAALDSER